MKRIYSKLEKMYPDSRTLQKAFLFDKSVTVFRMDLDPEKFQGAGQKLATLELAAFSPEGDFNVAGRWLFGLLY